MKPTNAIMVMTSAKCAIGTHDFIHVGYAVGGLKFLCPVLYRYACWKCGEERTPALPYNSMWLNFLDVSRPSFGKGADLKNLINSKSFVSMRNTPPT